MTARKKPEDFLPNGRPSKYTPALAQEICDTIASSDLGLVHLVEANPHWPIRSTIFKWLRLYPTFRDNYYKAKEDQCEVVAEYMHEAMNEAHKTIDEETGQVKVDVPLLKLKIDYMKWQVGKLKCKKYGDAKPDDIQNNQALHEEAMKRKAVLYTENKKEY